jgi:hypothetical protein
MGGTLYILEASWLNGMRPKDIALLVFDRSKRRKCAVYKALQNNFGCSKSIVKMVYMDHIVQFSKALINA